MFRYIHNLLVFSQRYKELGLQAEPLTVQQTNLTACFNYWVSQLLFQDDKRRSNQREQSASYLLAVGSCSQVPAAIYRVNNNMAIHYFCSNGKP